MIKFFRHIRRNLFKENKPTFSKASAGKKTGLSLEVSAKTGKPASQWWRYLKYAIGEILLVVIGIMIALQLNNWNQSISEQNISKDYLGNLRTELKSDLDYFDQIITRNDEQKTYIDEILKAMYTEKIDPSKEMELISKLSEAMDPTDFFPKTATYQDLVSSGKMTLIKPINFRQRIITHYNLMKQKSLHITSELGYSWNHLIPFLNNMGIFEWENFPEIALDTSIVPQTKRFSLLSIDKNSKDFEAAKNNLYFAKLMLTKRKQALDELTISTVVLIDEINNILSSGSPKTQY